MLFYIVGQYWLEIRDYCRRWPTFSMSWPVLPRVKRSASIWEFGYLGIVSIFSLTARVVVARYINQMYLATIMLISLTLLRDGGK